jgi:hypothetical protein
MEAKQVERDIRVRMPGSQAQDPGSPGHLLQWAHHGGLCVALGSAADIFLTSCLFSAALRLIAPERNWNQRMTSTSPTQSVSYRPTGCEYATIASSGIDGSAKQYQELQDRRTRHLQFSSATSRPIRNQAIPTTASGKAYIDHGEKPQAIANYQLNPKNHDAFQTLQKLNAPWLRTTYLSNQ